LPLDLPEMTEHQRVQATLNLARICFSRQTLPARRATAERYIINLSALPGEYVTIHGIFHEIRAFVGSEWREL
jgi:hypothetical protein